MKLDKDTQLDIFNNHKYDEEKILAPNSGEEYKFCVKNTTGVDVLYNINFEDEMSNFVNMKFKLKMDNIYIKGNKENSVSIEELNLKDVIVSKDSSNIFTLEWEWEDCDEKDTYVGIRSREENQYYKLDLKIQAKELSSKE